MMSADWLDANRFVEFGAWLGPMQKLKRTLKIGRRVPGVYVFVVKGKIVYIGMATHLRGRVRNYNRYRQSNEKRLHRGAHSGLLTTLSKPGATVKVFVCRTNTVAKARECETRWIKKFDPKWNKAGRDLGAN